LDLQAYISSGILESYALGATTPQETAEVEEMVAKNPALNEEIIKIKNDLAAYAGLFEKEPPVDLKEKIRKQLFETQAPAHEVNFAVSKNETINSNGFNWRVAASWALLAFSICANFYFFNRWKNTEEKLALADAQNVQMAQNDVILKANYESKIALMQNADFKKVLLLGTDKAPKAAASIYFNPKNNEVFIASLNMPELPTDKQYQLWAIIDGKPVDAGLIYKADSLGKMKPSPNATAFAISIENIGGSTTEAGPKGDVLAMGGV
jgi:anti-sigma-K factor RskA